MFDHSSSLEQIYFDPRESAQNRIPPLTKDNTKLYEQLQPISAFSKMEAQTPPAKLLLRSQNGELENDMANNGGIPRTIALCECVAERKICDFTIRGFPYDCGYKRRADAEICALQGFPVSRFLISAYWKYEEEGGMAGLGGDADAHPFICFTMNLV
ncbi:hypothetical protein Vadar_002059 [Vaccinium darrowii]|uniref:Uncharacterized protein n=1 Tax=Vaccinium darrowii TaxID=229202 RepID=A0ACB7Z9H4_9ERIC|nr:hypothetical protein Vadar_002059 [Vaccinium darrowii]